MLCTLRDYAVALVFFLALGLTGPAASWAAKAAPASAESRETSRLYQAGMDHYSRGDLAAALASFREALRREPGNLSALAAVHRVEIESARQTTPTAAPRPAPVRAKSLDRFFLVSLPRWYYFERTIGDGMRDVGTLTALNASIVQLLGERKFALAQNRPFRKERRLRELLRRTPGTAERFEEV
jgi:hypothetical protein